MLSWEDRVEDCLGLCLQERSQGTALRLESDKLGSLERRAGLREQLGDAVRISRGILCRVHCICIVSSFIKKCTGLSPDKPIIMFSRIEMLPEEKLLIVHSLSRHWHW